MYTLYSMQRSGNSYKVRLALATATALIRTGVVRNPVGAGLVVYADDDRFISLLHRARGAMRLTPFAKEVPAGEPRVPSHGSMSVGPPGDLTELRLVHRLSGGHELFRAYTRQDGRRWIRGGTWTTDVHP